MGKLGRTRRGRGSHRADPLKREEGKVEEMIAASAGDEPDEAEDGGIDELLAGMRSFQPQDRSRAADLAGGIGRTKRGARILQERGVTAKLTSLLCDSSEEVKEAAAIALRACCGSGGEAAYEAAVRGDLMTPLLSSIASHVRMSGTPGAAGRDELLCELLDLLWETCEVSSQAVKRVNDAAAGLLPALCRCLALGAPSPAAPLPIAVRIACSAANCISVLSEDNPPISSMLAGHPEALLAIQRAVMEEGYSSMVAVLSVGILINIGQHAQPPEFAQAMRRIFGRETMIKAIIGGPLLPCCLVLTCCRDADLKPPENGEGGQQTMEEESGGHAQEKQGKRPSIKPITHGVFHEQFLHTEGIASTFHNKYSAWRDEVAETQLALEIISNLMVPDDKEDEEEEEGWQSADEEEEGSEMLEEANVQEHSLPSAKLPIGQTEFASWLVRENLLDLVVLRTKGLSANLKEALATCYYDDVRYIPLALIDMQISAIECMSNWILSCPPGSQIALQQVRDEIILPNVLSVLQSSEQGKVEMEECLSATLFVLLEKALELEIRTILVLPSELQEALAVWAEQGATESNTSIGKILVKVGSRQSVHDSIDFSCQSAQSARSILVVAEAVNAMFDVYAEDDLNELVLRPLRVITFEMQAMFVAAMKQWLADNKAKIRQDPQMRNAADRLKEVKQNLPRFIKYKKDLGL
ncbi:hypothetical protein GUITHDRAFT_145163 [Guillardia theta CCMP2712]|uniref:SYO1-like TPR repeats domain-containing protein n=1 Tax=Guillardia theta (strain CCMP2712) TaxID=905079 RepID=L1IM67_GUITC|nr:hypothetical protein GUITHDRAFT_145163 [Guillardia theta CCMP2712]EKX37207.1 hypothetical protein GUITHDRAFT_145163 [Guillardia theta CCMP2712]|eukprot:XP_005824187.1 hypothetical protein GUITHDRAFT_145163 [Guillardia theta CCMP2712]